MAKSTFTLAAPPADEAADALLIKPKQSKSSNIKGILAVVLSESPGSKIGLKIAKTQWSAERIRSRMLEAAAHAA